MAPKPPLRHQEVRRIIGLLQPLAVERRIVLIGGQAVAFWLRFLHPAAGDAALADALTSKDIDFEGSAQSVRRAGELLSGRVRIATIDDSTPNTGIVLFTDADGVEREIDFLDAPLGLTARDVRDTAVRLVLPATDGTPETMIWVMHPERCMESRVINASVLGKTDSLAIRQLNASIVCTREWSRFILNDKQVPEQDRVRAVLRINERIFRRCMRDKSFRDIAAQHGAQPFDAVLADHPLLPENARDRRYAQMREQLDERLKRDQRNQVGR